MALPTGSVTYPTRHGAFLRPREGMKAQFEDHSRGGATLNDATAGLESHNWTFRVNPDTGVVSILRDEAMVDASWYTITTGVFDFAASFDNNMQPVLGWCTAKPGGGGDAYFRWFDPTIPGFDTIQLDSGTEFVRVVMDDPRVGQDSARDTLITYLRAGKLYYRQLRDRFATEYELADIGAWHLDQFGMNSLLRMQWRFARPVVTL